MGGRDTVLQEAEKVYGDGDFQWSAELATHIIRIDPEDMGARNIKAAAFRNLGYAQMNINWRNWYLTSAMELDGSLDMESAHKLPGQKFTSPDVVKALPAGVAIEALTIRLIAEQTLDVHLTMGFQITDTNENYAIEIRRGVAQFHDRLPEKLDVKLEMKRSFLNENILDASSVKNGVNAGDIKVEGEWTDVEHFFNCFELEPFPIWLTIR
jgi:alkyl sulfatase BDS1-like metallo-beta-lactamase superfamily hydrolase